MHLRSLRWLTVTVPLLFLALLDLLRHQIWPELLHPWPGYLVTLVVVAGAIWVFSRMVFDRVQHMERQILDQNSELRELSQSASRQAAQLRALHAAGLTLSSDLGLENVLVQIVELARQLTGARYGALAVVDEGGRIVRFLTSGVTAEEGAALTDPPTGLGLLGDIFADDHPIRVADIAADPRSIGFPPGHPPMRTFLGMPIVRHARRYGNLYLTDKQSPAGPLPFARDDERLVSLFAAQAAIAMENARLHGEVQGLATALERERIARELHDSLAQALGYIRVQAAIGRDALAQQQPGVDVALSRIDEAASDAYAEVREAILGLRSGGSGDERRLVDALAEYLHRYREQTGVTIDLIVGSGVSVVGLAPAVEVQLVRIIQEALANVRKHARTAHAQLKLDLVTRSGGPRIRAVIADEGRGFDVGLPASGAAGAHFGLAVMRERAEGVGGTLTVASAPDRGTRVTVEMPLVTAPEVAVEAKHGLARSPGRRSSPDARGREGAADSTRRPGHR